MGRRRFDHLHAELSVAAGRRLPRYALWLALHDAGFDPERLAHGDVADVCERAIPRFLEAEGVSLGARRARALRRELLRYDPSIPSPYERFAALG